MPTVGQALAAILAKLAQIIGLVSGITTILTTLGIAVDGAATSTQADAILTDTGVIQGLLTDSTIGLAALKLYITSQNALILTAIAGVQQSGDPVTLPTTPPPGYGTGAVPSAADIWAYPMPDTGQPAADMLEDAGLLAINMATSEVILPLRGRPFLAIGGTWWNANSPESPSGQPTIDMTAILPADTLLTWLNRTSGYTTWDDNADGYAFVADGSSGGAFTYTTQITESQFPAFKESLVASTPRVAPPVWPGLANVTLGTPVALSAGFTITEDMDGVIVEIASVPPQTSFFQFDGTLSYRYLGALAFVDDNGEYELPQNLGFQFAVYSPKEMTIASGVSVRVKAGVTGTITPWTIN